MMCPEMQVIRYMLISTSVKKLLLVNSENGLLTILLEQANNRSAKPNPNKYHPTSGLMQILHFDWLRYYRSISNSHRVAKFASFVNLFISVYFQISFFR